MVGVHVEHVDAIGALERGEADGFAINERDEGQFAREFLAEGGYIVGERHPRGALAVAVIILGENFDAGAKNLGERARVGGQIGTQGGGAHRFTSHVVVPSLLSLSWTPMASNSSRMRSDSAQFFAARAARRAVMRD